MFHFLSHGKLEIFTYFNDIKRLWWSYPLMDLSSFWLKYRRDLPVGTSDLGSQLFIAFWLYIAGLVLFIALTLICVRNELVLTLDISRYLFCRG